MSVKHRKQDKTWFDRGKVGGGPWERVEPGLNIGYAVGQSDRYQAAGAPGYNDEMGLVFVRECTAVKSRARGVVQAPDTLTQTLQGYRFGAAVDLKWPLLAVGSPGHSDNRGAAYLFLYQAGVWTPIGATIHRKTTETAPSMFGKAVALCGATLYVGAPHASDAPGCVQYTHVDEDGAPAWKKEDFGILWQCVRGRAGVSLPENIFHRAARKVVRDKGAPWPLAKIMMIGEGRVGKTALRNALLGKPFADTNSTIGIETLTVGRLAITGTGQGHWIEDLEVEAEGVEVEMRERAIAKQCVQQMHAGAQVAARAPRKAMVDLMCQKFTAGKQQSSDTGASVSVDEDAEPPQMDMKRVQDFMRSCDEEREEMAMEMWDFGGQSVFYILYHLFLTVFGTYVLTFSMDRLAPSALASEREQTLAMIRYWLDNIALHTGTGHEEHNAPLFLVGTHKDKVPEPRDHEAISQLLWANFSQHVQWPYVVALKEGVVSTGRGLLWFYPVDNTRSCGMFRDPVLNQLIKSLEATVEAKDHVHRLVPFLWMSLYDKLQAELLSGKLVVSMEQVQGLARDCGIAPEDVWLVLRYLDCMGLLLYCAENRMHDAAVVLDTTNFLVRAATTVLCQHDIHLESTHQEAAQGHGALWKELISSGILDTALLPLLWKDFEPSSHAILLSLMHRFALICPITATSVHQPPSRFIVPCLLPDDALSLPPAGARTCFLAFSSGPIADLSDSDTLTFDSLRNFFLPEGLFARVIAKCVEWIQQTGRDKTPMKSMSLKRREAFLSFGPHRCILQHVPRIHSIRVHILVENTEVVTDRLEHIINIIIAESYPKLTATLLVPCDGTDDEQGADRLLSLHVLRRAVEEKRGLWLGDVLVPHPELLSRFAAFLQEQGLLESYDVLISYRWTPKYGAVCDDTSLSVKLFDVLGSYAVGAQGRRPAVFLDRQRLQHGQRWDFDCMLAVASTSIVVPIVSVDALQRMIGLVSPDRTQLDCVLLEWCLVTVLQELRVVSKVLPIVLGRIQAGQPTNFYTSGVREQLPHVVAAPEIAKVREFLDRKGLPTPTWLSTVTVRRIVDGILLNLGIHLWDLPHEGTDYKGKEVSTGEEQVQETEEEEGEFVMLDAANTGFGAFHLYETAAAQIIQYVEQSLSKVDQQLSSTHAALAPPGGGAGSGRKVEAQTGQESVNDFGEAGAGAFCQMLQPSFGAPAACDSAATAGIGATSASVVAKAVNMSASTPSGSEAPVWLRAAMQDDEVAAFEEAMRVEAFDDLDLEFFSDEALKKAGIHNAITRSKMLRRIRDHFKP